MSHEPTRAQLHLWREQGSLRYLAALLKVTTKQVSRYWDDGWIPGQYGTPRGHRRIRYDDHTVERVARRVQLEKTTNIAVRYHLDSVTHRGVRIAVKGCNTTQDLFRRLRRAGVPPEEARRIAFRPRSPHSASAATPLGWDLLQALKGTSQDEINATTRLYATLPLDALLEPCPAKEFRARTREAWRGLIEEHQKLTKWDRIHGASAEEMARREQDHQALRALLQQPDQASFSAAFVKAHELSERIFEFDDDEHRQILKRAETRPEETRLELAALHLRRTGQKRTATALARVLGISRPALYRAFGQARIEAALRTGRI